MITNTAATLYMQEGEGWKRALLHDICWFSRLGASRDSYGEQRRESVICFIPVAVDVDGLTYAEPHAYERLSTEEKALRWSLREGDMLVKGIHGEVDDMAVFRDSTDDALNIREMREYRIGSEDMWHFVVKGM